jgi:hypothetical protein
MGNAAISRKPHQRRVEELGDLSLKVMSSTGLRSRRSGGAAGLVRPGRQRRATIAR